MQLVWKSACSVVVQGDSRVATETFIYPAVVMSSLNNDTMTADTTYWEPLNRYRDILASEDSASTAGYGVTIHPLKDLPATLRYTHRDAETLAMFLRPVDVPLYSSVAQQVFGARTRESGISMEHLLNLFYERARIHERHMNDIERRHHGLQEQLFGAQLHSSLDNHKRELTVQSSLMQLDSERRKEELAFWKDSSDIRESLFDAAKEYQASRHRASFLEGLESGGMYDA